MSIIILYGREGTGKTRRSKEFKAHFGCSRIIDGWDGQPPLKAGDLAITNMGPPFNVPGARIIDAATAKAKLTGAGRRS